MDIYFSIEHDLSKKLMKSEYERYSEGVFGKKIGIDAYSWISISGNDYFLTPLIGVVFPRLNDIMYNILGGISPSVLQYKLPSAAGPPFAVVPLKSLLADDKLALAWETPDQPLATNVSDVLCDALRATARPFFEANASLDTATTTVDLQCKFGSAQKYLYPIAAHILKKESDLIQYYTNQAADTFTAPAQREMYLTYCRNLIDYLAERERLGG